MNIYIFLFKKEKMFKKYKNIIIITHLKKYLKYLS